MRHCFESLFIIILHGVFDSFCYSFNPIVERWLKNMTSSKWTKCLKLVLYSKNCHCTKHSSIKTMVERSTRLGKCYASTQFIHSRIEWVFWWNYCRNADSCTFSPSWYQQTWGGVCFWWFGYGCLARRAEIGAYRTDFLLK